MIGSVSHIGDKDLLAGAPARSFFLLGDMRGDIQT